MNSTVFKLFLHILLYLATTGLAAITSYQCNFASASLWCASNSQDCESYTLELNSNDTTWNITEQFIEYNQECHYSIHLQTGEIIKS